MSKRRISWTKTASEQFKSAIKYIRKDSDTQAENVKEKLLSKISLLKNDKGFHRLDPYKINNDGCFLYFEYLKYRIVYYVASPEEVIIFRIRHTSQEPEQY